MYGCAHHNESRLMEIAWYVYVLAILAGILAGVINTLAGSGSLVTLPMLVFLGLPASAANATNRVGVAVQNVVGILTFQRSGTLNTAGSAWLVVPSVLGALVGARIAVNLNERVMNLAIGTIMVIMLVVILLKPARWLREQSELRPGRPSPWVLGLFFIIGIYGGFIQAGVGVFLLSAMVLGVGYSLNHANVVKLIIVLFSTLFALVIFVLNDQVHWGLGALMAVGQSIGAWAAARFATRYPGANVWIRRLLIAVVVISILRFFGIWDLILSGVTL